MKLHQLNVVMFKELSNAYLKDEGFTRVSYGDAVYTLVYPQDLIAELKDPDMDPLVEELEKLPRHCLIALDG